MVYRMKKLVVLGSTGSIGRQTLEIVRAFPERFEVVALACGKNVSLLEKQIAEFRPRFVGADSAEDSEKIAGAKRLSLEELASHPDVDLVVLATAGRAGLGPALAAITAGKTVALANKEVLVMAGEIVTAEARRHKVEIMPIDSEHSAIWQCLRGEESTTVARLILTASGGPFRLYSSEQLAAVTPEEALNHPTWQMGAKVTIDSATLMNKGLEVIEAHWLFGIPFAQVEVVLHPQSIIHSVVEFVDGSAKAQLSLPDMRLPIQYALTYPERWEGPFRVGVDYGKLGLLDFGAVDVNRFPCLKLAVEAGEKGGTYTAVLSAADEVAVELFLTGKISFTDIATLIKRTLDRHEGVEHPSLEQVLEADGWARETARALVLR
ncbi:MAG TPA: 1-deoxy-D-xylulose-5-phosphate reductoisomerase [Dehalococcoidia bacterium]|nr:1-deoxy-D-xylulose-5-phosphate reductoisomerase [Dehalococcoidia bacterium]